VAGYALTSAIFVVTSARLGDRFGRRRSFSAGLALFTLASAGCGAASTPTELVVARLVQGVAAALMAPNVLSIIGVLFTGPARVRALSVYGTVMDVAAVGGQLVGGALIALDPAGLGWRSCFLINVPIGIAASLLAPRVIPETRIQERSPLDVGGTILVTCSRSSHSGPGRRPSSWCLRSTSSGGAASLRSLRGSCSRSWPSRTSPHRWRPLG